MNGPWSLPAQWHWSTFGEVARVAADLVDPANYLDMPHVAPNHIEAGSGRLLPYTSVRVDGVTSAKHRFHRGQVLYSKIRPYLAKVVLADFEGLCSADMYPIETSLEPQFLKWWMLTEEFTRQAADQQARTVLPKINKASLLRLLVPVPPLEEQRRILDILEAHLSRLDAALAEGGRARTRLPLLWLSFLTSEYFRASRQGHAVPLGELCDSSLGKMLDAKKNVGQQTQYLRNANVRWGTFDLADVSSAPMTDADRNRLALEVDDILVCEGGEPGRCAVWPGSSEPMTFQKALHRLRVRDVSALSPRFVALMLEQAVRSGRTAGLITGTTIKHLPQERLRSLAVPVPRLADQHEAVRRAAEMSDSLNMLDHELRSLVAREGALRRSLLEVAFSGGLTSAESTDLMKDLSCV